MCIELCPSPDQALFHYMLTVQVELPKLQAAISIACRLGFAKRLPNPNEGMHRSSRVPLCSHLGSLCILLLLRL